MLRKMLYNGFKNHNWIEIGIEAIWVAIYLEYSHRVLLSPYPDVLSWLLHHINDLYMPLVFTFVGCYCIVIALFDIRFLHAQLIATAMAQFMFTLLLIAFIDFDLHMGTLSWTTGFLVVISLRLYIQPVRSALMVKLIARVANDQWDRK